MPCASPASAGLSLRLSETKGSTAAKAYQSAARNISQRMASASMPFCHRAIRRRSLSEMVVQVVVSMVIIGSRGLRVGGIGAASGRRRQEIHLVLGGMSHHLLRIGEIWMRSNSSFSDRVG